MFITNGKFLQEKRNLLYLRAELRDKKVTQQEPKKTSFVQKQKREKIEDKVIVWRSAGSAFLQPVAQCVKNRTESIFLSNNEKGKRKKGCECEQKVCK